MNGQADAHRRQADAEETERHIRAARKAKRDGLVWLRMAVKSFRAKEFNVALEQFERATIEARQ